MFIGKLYEKSNIFYHLIKPEREAYNNGYKKKKNNRF